MSQKPKKNLSAVTIRRLRKVATAIMAQSSLYDQYEYVRPSRTCGSASCIFGWAVHLFKPRQVYINRTLLLYADGNWILPALRSFARGLKALGFDVKSEADMILGNRLWAPGAWPDEFIERYADTESGSVERAQVAVDRIEHFIATDGAE